MILRIKLILSIAATLMVLALPAKVDACAESSCISGGEVTDLFSSLAETNVQSSGFTIQIHDSMMVRIAVAAGVLLVMGFVVLFVGLLRDKRQHKLIELQKEKISNHNEVLAERNEEIINNLHMARQFQASIVCTEEDLKNVFPNSFLLYQPMDVVSGDLPIMFKHDKHIYIGAIDCVGHGVPAAMLTFIAYYNLRDIILHSAGKLSCSELLSRLNQSVSEAFRNDSPERQMMITMDGSICKINLEDMTAEFSGAHLPLMIMRGDEIITIKGDVWSIGEKFDNTDFQFADNLYKLEDGDQLFLLTDGLIHQRGGERNKSFSMKRLREFLVGSGGKAFNTIKDNLNETLNTWKGKNPQTDDLMLIGLTVETKRQHIP